MTWKQWKSTPLENYLGLSVWIISWLGYLKDSNAAALFADSDICYVVINLSAHSKSNIYASGRLGGPYREKLWPRAFSSPRSQFFPVWSDPKLANNIFIFFSCLIKPAYKWVCLRKFAIESAYAPSTNHLQKILTSKHANKSDTKRRKMY